MNFEFVLLEASNLIIKGETSISDIKLSLVVIFL